MGDVEPEPAAAFRIELGLAGRIIDEADLAGISGQASSQQLAQRPARDHEAPPVTIEAKPRGSAPFVIRERRIIRLGSDIQTHAPQLNGVHHVPSRTPSARATTISRGPSKDSRPCAVRMLSTTSTSPACHGSRTA